MATLDSANFNHEWRPAGNSALKIEEEQSSDVELNHADETTHMLILDGHLFAQDVSTNDSDTAGLRRNILDSDGDDLVDVLDSDDDNDGVADHADALPLDRSESLDTDGDGIGNNADPDDDNDEVSDNIDAFPLNASESLDTDRDAIGNNSDPDDDNDGLSDTWENNNGFNPLDGSDCPSWVCGPSKYGWRVILYP